MLVLCRYSWWRHWSSVTYDRKDLQATAHAANQTSWMHSTHSRPQSKGFQVGMLCIVRFALSRIFEAWFRCTSFGSSLQKHVHLKITAYTVFHNANILVKITIQGTICNVAILIKLYKFGSTTHLIVTIRMFPPKTKLTSVILVHLIKQHITV